MVMKYEKEIKGLGNRISKARKKKKSSRESLAQKARMSSATLEKIETGEVKNPTAANVMDIANCLDIRVDKLLGKKVTHKNKK